MNEGQDESGYWEFLLDSLSDGFYDTLIFIGVIDEKAKLLHFQKGKSKFVLPPSDQQVHDLKISIMFSVAKYLENLAGCLEYVVLYFKSYELIVIEMLPMRYIYAVCRKGSAADIADMLMGLIGEDLYEKHKLLGGQKPENGGTGEA